MQQDNARCLKGLCHVEKFKIATYDITDLTFRLHGFDPPFALRNNAPLVDHSNTSSTGRKLVSKSLGPDSCLVQLAQVNSNTFAGPR